MCEEADEAFDLYKVSTIVARKQHKCIACNDPIERGHTYFKVFTKFDGEVEAYKHCKRCRTIYKRLLRDHDGNIWVDPELNCGTSWREAFGEEPPDEVARLAFMTPDEAQSLEVKP